MNPIKLIVSSKNNLKFKYGNKFSEIEKLLKNLQVADKKKGLDTRIVFIDDATSAKRSHIKAAKAITEQEAKRAIDDLYKRYLPAYIVIIGAQDIFPFQEIDNPTEDEDPAVPSDLPYACDAPFSRKIENFVLFVHNNSNQSVRRDNYKNGSLVVIAFLYMACMEDY